MSSSHYYTDLQFEGEASGSFFFTEHANGKKIVSCSSLKIRKW